MKIWASVTVKGSCKLLFKHPVYSARKPWISQVDFEVCKRLNYDRKHLTTRNQNIIGYYTLVTYWTLFFVKTCKENSQVCYYTGIFCQGYFGVEGPTFKCQRALQNNKILLFLLKIKETLISQNPCSDTRVPVYAGPILLFQAWRRWFKGPFKVL